jgi:hypothetical protein
MGFLSFFYFLEFDLGFQTFLTEAVLATVRDRWGLGMGQWLTGCNGQTKLFLPNHFLV